MRCLWVLFSYQLLFAEPLIWPETGTDLFALRQDSLIAMEQIENEMPERLFFQEFAIIVDPQMFEKPLKKIQSHPHQDPFFSSQVAFLKTENYLLQTTLSGQNIGLRNTYEEFIETPYWKTPETQAFFERLEKNE